MVYKYEQKTDQSSWSEDNLKQAIKATEEKQ